MLLLGSKEDLKDISALDISAVPNLSILVIERLGHGSWWEIRPRNPAFFKDSFFSKSPRLFRHLPITNTNSILATSRNDYSVRQDWDFSQLAKLKLQLEEDL